MGFFELLFVAIGLSMDAFAVAICKGLSMKKINYNKTFIIALFFGGFQGLMPLIGWLLGTKFEKYITTYDHWIAFVLLGIIGGKMIYEALQPDADHCELFDELNIKDLFLLAIATSIDALAVGITLALLPNTNIILSITVIALITFSLSFIGVIIGNKFGSKYKSKSELLGGIILVAIGIKILLEHLNII
ncbi:MAG: manganese efflux pump [Christensenellaceae bacterium]|nr:manganese efflux pump [Christensenellaceae bacterium]